MIIKLSANRSSSPAISRRQTGQSMVEYVVILAALSAALLAPGLGSVGITQNESGSLLEAIASKHRGHSYALSLSEIPETDDLTELSVYYGTLGKYPELSPQLAAGASTLGNLANTLNQVDNTLQNFDISKFKDPFNNINVKPDLGIFDTFF